YYGYLPTSGAPSPYSWQLTQNFRVPEGFFYALGDNSANSYDSRGWGGVPADDIVGSALFILYPFSSRWGLAE
ncbi:MAG: S26 family signal peptidase, partial [Opitutales bacterium]|nr:S26 family signal peptidase [Opitutales bacterium]